jgi:hypothetical protein
MTLINDEPTDLTAELTGGGDAHRRSITNVAESLDDLEGVCAFGAFYCRPEALRVSRHCRGCAAIPCAV